MTVPIPRVRRLVATFAVPFLALPLLAAGCSGTAAGSGSSTDRTPTAAASPTASPSPTGPSVLTLGFAGDVHFTERTLPLLDNPATAYGPVASVLSGTDLSMVNLETAVTDRGTPEPKQFHFRAPASAYAATKAAGVDVVTLANNHALDYGRTGLADTLAAARQAAMPVVGAGNDAARAYAPWIGEVRGTRVAFLGFSQIGELADSWAAQDSRSGIAMAFDTDRAVAAVHAARQHADVVVVYVHWGQEGNDCPISDQRNFATAMAGAGADAVLGTHAHLLLGDGWLGRTYVAYGLGNFLWWYDDAFSNDTGVLRLTVTGRTVTKAQLVPTSISRTTGQPIPVTGAEAARITAKFAGLRACTGLADHPS